MNLSKFKEKITDLNNTSWGFGNEILYQMAKDPDDLKDPPTLAGAIWLIGRAYAASPQRRSYKKLWPVTTQNDGREGFFDAIAKNMDLSCLNEFSTSASFSFASQLQRDPKSEKISSLTFDDDDKELLINSIVTVLSFNQALGEAIEQFDRVPPSKIFQGKHIRCNNHISFASKFLHFYFPNTVFIIDNFAYNGACALFNGNAVDKKRYLEIPATNELYLKTDVYDEFPKSVVSKLCKELTPEILRRWTRTDTASLEADDREVSASEQSDNLKAKHYVNHCIRSYLMGVFLTTNGIVPSCQIRTRPDFCPMPRLTDTVFLNVKKELNNNENKYQKKLDEIFYSHS